ncbi:hypothetical protein G3480_23785 [Thiorhodococcus mannitoliphagus]|uniref:Type 4 fimbrial biogenesis protein PilX N-terminal domain-containing protein n=1 Tax=Thiorhodococcus mannitoliphagus TaxID=329406 RepID=A0A6P1E0I3_9GAMM|nr:PilX N-terminal domain-containing pilus assembly protein [Thiorhodococcus mannitoliphagus]NEX23280.1 hypothetical protein [Thiorhodococcus mannitoliphagus]
MKTYETPRPQPSRRRQEGVVLVIGLIILLVMTIIGMTAIQTTSLDEHMAGNVRARNVAFQGAEAALRAGESWINATSNQAAATASTNIANPAQWDGTSSPARTGFLSVSTWPADSRPAYSDFASDGPSYHVGPPYEVSPGGIEWGTAPTEPREIYVVTALSRGATDTAIVILQTMYEP